MLSRRLLFRSAVWEVARPRLPLTEGHFLIRLSDPSIAFTEESAADWLLCHNLARRALSTVLGAERCGVMFAYEWHPIGDAIGEPAAESSTPTFHLFGRWPAEPLAPADQLLLPASHRIPPPQTVLEQLDGDLRAELQESLLAPASAPPTEKAPEESTMGNEPAVLDRTGVSDGTGLPDKTPVPEEAADTEEAVRPAPSRHLPAMAKWKAAQQPGSGHRVFTPARQVRTVSDTTPQELLALATGLLALPRGGAASGFSCVVSEASGSEDRLQFHALSRSAAESVNPLEGFLRSSEVSHALL